MIRSIIKDSKTLHKELKNRWKELNLTQQQVAERAKELSGDNGFTRQAVNYYTSNPYRRGALNEEQILFLAKMYNIDVELIIKTKKYGD